MDRFELLKKFSESLSYRQQCALFYEESPGSEELEF